jgi:hypothetical protein
MLSCGVGVLRFWRERRHASATKLAAVYKAHLVRLDMQDLLFEKRQVVCATTLQSVFRAHRARISARRAIVHHSREYQHAAAVRVQTAMRGKWARSAMQRVGMIVMETRRLRQEADRERRRLAALCIKTRVRSYLAREFILWPERAMRWRHCAHVLSRVYRGHIGRRLCERRRYEVEMEAAMKLQSSYRLHLARLLLRHTVEQQRLASLLAVAERQETAAATIQHAYFMHVSRLIMRDRASQVILRSMLAAAPRRAHSARIRLIMREEAAREIACSMRRTCVRVRYTATLRRETSAAVIQRACLMHAARVAVRGRQREREEAAARLIGCMLRRMLAAAGYRACVAALTLQASVRRQKGRRLMAGARARAEHQLEVVAASEALAACVRRVCMRNKLRRKVAAGRLAAAALTALIRQSYASKVAVDSITARCATVWERRRYLMHRPAALLLSTAAKRAFALQEYAKLRGCIRLQSVWRGHLDRSWTRAYESELKQHRWKVTCILKLQATQRGHAARSAVGELQHAKARMQGAVELRAHCRQLLAAGAYRRQLVALKCIRWATVLQRYWRGALARHHRKQLAVLRLRCAAAVRVQCAVRGRHARLRKLRRVREVVRIQAAVRLQCWFRVFVAVAAADVIRQRNLYIAAATTMQAGARGMAARTRVRRLREQMLRERSAVEIQRIARGMLGRAAAQRRREQKVMEEEMRQQQAIMEEERRQQMAINIQSCYRQHVARAVFLQLVEENEQLECVRAYCADLLQCAVRCFNARHRLQKRAQAAVLITALGRGWLARRKALKRSQVLDRQNLYVAPHKLRPELYAVPPGLNLRRPKAKSKVHKFRAEADEKQPSPPSAVPWHERQRRAVIDFQTKPSIKAFFSDLEQREHGKSQTVSKSQSVSKPSGTPFAPAKAVQSLVGPEKMVRPATVMEAHAATAGAVSRPKSAMPANAGRLQPLSANKGRVPPRFQKVRQAKAAGVDSGIESGGSVKAGKQRARSSSNQRPRPRGSDSERNSDGEVEVPAPKPQASMVKTAEAGMAAPVPAPLPELVPALGQRQQSQPIHRRSLYNTEDISSDPTSDEKHKKKNKDKEKKRSVSPVKAASPPPNTANADPKIEAAFNYCKLGKYREVETALAGGLLVDTRCGPSNNTMLLECAQNGQKRIAKLLLRNFAEMNAQNSNGDTSLHLCFKFNYTELGEYLKSKGANDNIRNNKGQTCYEAKK